jgi:hypothetical protein
MVTPAETLQQQAQAWLANRNELRASGDRLLNDSEVPLRVTWKSQAINPYSLPSPLQQEVLRQMDSAEE